MSVAEGGVRSSNWGSAARVVWSSWLARSCMVSLCVVAMGGLLKGSVSPRWRVLVSLRRARAAGTPARALRTRCRKGGRPAGLGLVVRWRVRAETKLCCGVPTALMVQAAWRLQPGYSLRPGAVVAP